MTTPQEDTELIRELDTLIIAHNQYIDNVWKGSADLKNPPETSEKILALINARDEQRESEIRRVAKMENARDFSAVVKVFNEALSAGFDAPSVRSLRMVINGADARANYIDLPEQITKPQQQDKEEE